MHTFDILFFILFVTIYHAPTYSESHYRLLKSRTFNNPISWNKRNNASFVFIIPFDFYTTYKDISNVIINIKVIINTSWYWKSD